MVLNLELLGCFVYFR